MRKRMAKKLPKKKCQHCGKFTTTPYKVTKVPGFRMAKDVPNYVKRAKGRKNPRAERFNGVVEKHYCNTECYMDSVDANISPV